jgi:hypothetical protein
MVTLRPAADDVPGLPGAAKRLNMLRSPGEVQRVQADPGIPGDLSTVKKLLKVLPGPMAAWQEAGNGCFRLEFGSIRRG